MTVIVLMPTGILMMRSSQEIMPGKTQEACQMGLATWHVF
ncbi:hypothetical protein NX02_01405 [Sphingomonas sanxanigenens DSM 19645 = NX02]|uniref:Uncharacterized protein n=1 Tax=Sphingomonas sanxanigenens DSM 19645 = NX02 TaxID=1123269 RepID=W0A6F5_9SPHN|nr:hypothetical protein NX02_01405 [Sphingomonas sanxanigenens DSM 19645 = NX02]